MNTYRIEYTEVKPGGHRDRQCDLVRGSRSDAVNYLAELTANIVPGSIEVFEGTASDGEPRPIGNLGFED